MPAISKSWVTIADTAVDPDSPLDAALMTGLRDDLVHLREWLGADYTAGAVTNHNHDGSNSAAIEIGPNWLRNGNFENGTTGWTLTNYTGGTVAVNTANETEGLTCLAITSTVAANGGGNAVSNEYIKCSTGNKVQVSMTLKSSGATVPVKAQVIWYDQALAQVSTSDLINITAGAPTTDRLLVRRVAAPATARYMKVKLELPTSAGATGTIYFDQVIVGLPALLGGEQVFISSGTFSAVWGDVWAEVQGAGGGGGGGTTGGNGGLGGFGGRANGFYTISGDVTVTCSASGGTAGAAGGGGDGGSGGGGGTSSFGAFCSATGGGAGTGGLAAGPTAGTPGAYTTGTGGTFNYKGNGSSPSVNTANKGDGGAGGTSGGAGSAGIGGYVLVRW
jgi:hypothetical protein